MVVLPSESHRGDQSRGRLRPRLLLRLDLDGRLRHLRCSHCHGGLEGCRCWRAGVILCWLEYVDGGWVGGNA
jgi:hypothetical protein